MKPYLILLLLFFVSCSPNFEQKYASTKAPWQNEVSKLTALDATESYTNNAILFIGSSSIRLWSNIKNDMAPFEPIRRGYGGAKFSDLVHFTKDIVYPHNFKAVCVFVANDITGSETDVSPKEGLQLFKYVEKQIREKYPNKPIFFIGITPSNSRWSVWNKQKEMNKLVSSYASHKKNLFYINTEANFLNAKGTPRSELFIKDQLHLNQDGYTIWAKYIKDSLIENL